MLFRSSSVPDAILNAQAEERATQVAGRRVTVVTFETPGTVDDRIREIIRNASTISDELAGRGLRDLLLRTDV